MTHRITGKERGVVKSEPCGDIYQMASTEQTQSKENPEEGEKRVGCAHYKRRAKFVVGVLTISLFQLELRLIFCLRAAGCVAN